MRAMLFLGRYRALITSVNPLPGWVRTVQLAIGLAVGLVCVTGGAEAWALSLRVSSAGYQSQAPKQAVLEGVNPGAKLKCYVYDPHRPGALSLTRGRVVYRIEAIEKTPDASVQGPLAERWILDFSAFQQSGDYELRVEGLPSAEAPLSAPLRISEFTYWDAMVPVIRSFYLQRSGIALQDDATGLSHALAHASEALVANGPDRRAHYYQDMTGGWYNGPEFNQYVTPTGLSLGLLLNLYERSPAIFNTLKLAYPLNEDHLGDLPDMLHELRWGLDWLMAMQRRDGAFFRKIAGRSPFPSGTPDADEQERVVFGVTSQDTAVATAALAMASRAYQRKDMGYAVKCLMAAEAGWKFLATHGLTLDVSPDDATGSREYLNAQGDSVYRFWAATELAMATGKPAYRQYLLTHYRAIRVEPVSWENPAFLGIGRYLSRKHATDDPLVTWFRPRSLQLADSLRQSADRARERSPYATTLSRFEAASLRQLLAQSDVLLTAHRLTRKSMYLNSAVANVAFVFGLNPLGKTFVTGHGPTSPQRVCHPWLRVAKRSMPGLLVSGPNTTPTDKQTPPNREALSYADDPDACASNASELLDNASLAAVLGALNLEFSPSSDTPTPF